MIYRTNAKLLSKLESLELVKKAAIEFLKALDSDAGYPMRRQESLRCAIDSSNEEMKLMTMTTDPLEDESFEVYNYKSYDERLNDEIHRTCTLCGKYCKEDCLKENK